FFQADDGIRDLNVTGVQTCDLPILSALGVPVGSEMKASHEMYATPRLVKFQEMEYAVPREKLPNILRMIDDVIRREKYAVHFPLECRFVKSDNIWLSPSYEGECGYICVYMV